MELFKLIKEHVKEKVTITVNKSESIEALTVTISSDKHKAFNISGPADVLDRDFETTLVNAFGKFTEMMNTLQTNVDDVVKEEKKEKEADIASKKKTTSSSSTSKKEEKVAPPPDPMVAIRKKTDKLDTKDKTSLTKQTNRLKVTTDADMQEFICNEIRKLLKTKQSKTAITDDEIELYLTSNKPSTVPKEESQAEGLFAHASTESATPKPEIVEVRAGTEDEDDDNTATDDVDDVVEDIVPEPEKPKETKKETKTETKKQEPAAPASVLDDPDELLF